MLLSVLDQSAVVTGRTADASIRESLSLARHAEALGYHRYWLAEHHNTAAIAGSAPEILIAAIAATTTRIRVGSAGVMLPHYSSLKVAEQFRVLEAIAPGRIDLGLGRAPGGDGLTAHALNPNAAVAAGHFPAQLRDLLAWVAGEKLAETHPFRDVLAMPTGPGVPEVWMLGSSDYGAQMAAHFGLPYCFAHFITDGQGAAEALAALSHAVPPERPPACALGCDLRLGAGGGHTGGSGAAVCLAGAVAARPRSWGICRPALARGGGCLSVFGGRAGAHRATETQRHLWHRAAGGSAGCGRWRSRSARRK